MPEPDESNKLTPVGTPLPPRRLDERSHDFDGLDRESQLVLLLWEQSRLFDQFAPGHERAMRLDNQWKKIRNGLGTGALAVLASNYFSFGLAVFMCGGTFWLFGWDPTQVVSQMLGGD